MNLYFQFCVLHFFSKIKYDLFGKLESSLDILWVENFNKIALSHMVKEKQAGLCFTR